MSCTSCDLPMSGGGGGHQSAGGSFDSYCSVCGLPFRPIESHVSTEWLSDALLTYKTHSVKLHSQGDYGAFDVKGTLPTDVASQFTGNNINKTKDGKVEIYTYEFLEEHPDAALIHEKCHHRHDAKFVAADHRYVLDHFQGQFFEDEEFLESTKYIYLLKEPRKATPVKTVKTIKASPEKTKKTTKAKPEKTIKTKTTKAPNEDVVPFSKYTIKQLTDLCDMLQIKKGKVKGDTIANIRAFVCSV